VRVLIREGVLVPDCHGRHALPITYLSSSHCRRTRIETHIDYSPVYLIYYMVGGTGELEKDIGFAFFVLSPLTSHPI
jgi:hypothetical protein